MSVFKRLILPVSDAIKARELRKAGLDIQKIGPELANDLALHAKALAPETKPKPPVPEIKPRQETTDKTAQKPETEPGGITSLWDEKTDISTKELVGILKNYGIVAENMRDLMFPKMVRLKYGEKTVKDGNSEVTIDIGEKKLPENEVIEICAACVNFVQSIQKQKIRQEPAPGEPNEKIDVAIAAVPDLEPVPEIQSIDMGETKTAGILPAQQKKEAEGPRKIKTVDDLLGLLRERNFVCELYGRYHMSVLFMGEPVMATNEKTGEPQPLLIRVDANKPDATITQNEVDRVLNACIPYLEKALGGQNKK